MDHVGLFEGIGGFALAARKMGWNTKAWCEINPFCQRVLRHHFPSAKEYSDIKKMHIEKENFTGSNTIITGGFPCQPYSTAGKRLGTEDERHLWPEMLRIIRAVQPRWVVGENVRGLISWDGGMVFDQVQTDLENEGYAVFPVLLPAAGVGAPHRRDRIWFIAYSHSTGLQAKGAKQQAAGVEQCGKLDGAAAYAKTAERTSTLHSWAGGDGAAGMRNAGDAANAESVRRIQMDDEVEAGQRNGHGPFSDGSKRTFTDAMQHGLQRSLSTDSDNTGRWQKQGRQPEKHILNIAEPHLQWANFPTESPICGGNDGFSSRLAGITFPKWRSESIKAMGNAIVPQVALQIFRAIEQYELILKQQK